MYLCPTFSKPLYFMLNNPRQYGQLAKHYSNIFRYKDDLLTLNNPTFEQAIRDFYPPQLELKRTTETNSRLSYLIRHRTDRCRYSEIYYYCV